MLPVAQVLPPGREREAGRRKGRPATQQLARSALAAFRHQAGGWARWASHTLPHHDNCRYRIVTHAPPPSATAAGMRSHSLSTGTHWHPPSATVTEAAAAPCTVRPSISIPATSHQRGALQPILSHLSSHTMRAFGLPQSAPRVPLGRLLAYQCQSLAPSAMPSAPRASHYLAALACPILHLRCL